MPDDLREQAKRRVTLLILGEVISQEGIQADADKVRDAVEEIAATYESPEEVVAVLQQRRAARNRVISD